MRRIGMQKLIRFGTDLLAKKGVPRDRARYVATLAVETEAFRQSTHGIVLLRGLAGSLGKGTDPRANPRVVRETPAAVLLDGEGVLAAWAMKVALEKAVRKARRVGIGFSAVRNCGWVAALGMHLARAARQGFVCQAWAQTSACRDCAPYGGIEACFSTNPIAIALPTGGDPVLADFSTATMSMGAAHGMIADGKRTSAPRFLDRRGRPTRDPSAIDKGGTLMFLGGDVEGHKGYALSLWNEALTVVAGGRANDPDRPSRQSFGVTVIDPARFGGRAYYRKEMRRLLRRVKSATPRPGFWEVRLPGERGWRALRDCRKNGVPLDAEKVKMLRDLGMNGV